MRVFVGVDSGGTRSSVTVQFEDSVDTIRHYETTSVLAGTTPPSMYASAVRDICSRAESFVDEVDPDSAVYLFFAAAGFAHSTRDDFADAFEEVIPQLFGGRVAIAGIVNDGTGLLLGLHADATVIAGTGSTVMVRPDERSVRVFGGHDWVGCDYGSGFWIGLSGIRQASKDFESGIESDLLERFREVYGVVRGKDARFIARLRELAMADAEMKGEIAKFAASVCQAASRGDLSSQDIVKRECEELADVAASALRRSFPPERLTLGVHLVQCGGLFSNDLYRTTFEKQLMLRLLNRDGSESKITWRRVETGRDAVLSLSHQLAEPHDALLTIDRQFAPLIMHF